MASSLPREGWGGTGVGGGRSCGPRGADRKARKPQGSRAAAEGLLECRPVAMETDPAVSQHASPQLSNCELGDGRLLITYAEVRRAPPPGVERRARRFREPGGRGHLSGSFRRQPGGPFPAVRNAPQGT